MENPYQAPQAELDTHGESSTPFFTTSITKLIVLYIATLGFYRLYWFYKHWKALQVHEGLKVAPVWRSIFNIFFTHSLFKHIANRHQEQGLGGWGAHAVLATLYVLMTVGGELIARMPTSDVFGVWDIVLLATSIIPLYTLYEAQTHANRVNQDPDGESNSRFSPWNILFILLGIAIWGVVVLGVLAQYTAILD
ncbi:Permease of the major facilitator superfamily [Hahella chejuensis KCTC 2396]|uniref:Permease of the major facilitator superfamily n=1 Tax=Hahella chejuensis (strain KCTC 2396) TaxID=349521 RepID=Q2SER2_HAHCH|nr:DUF4234 domain-containing protein [Hahella chejuensis]ABC30862.1 Permease of the major facilitator superfamily [Hahella chejuensis KCTC 2396]